MADTIKTSLGPVTAYADAKAHGYTGTREEFGQLLAGAAGNLQDAVAAKEGAEAAKQSAETAQQAAAENQKNAGIQAANAKASADTAAGQADAAKESATGAANSATAAQESETNAGLSATAAANAEAAAKQAQQAAETAKTDAEAAKTAAGTSADAAAASAADAKKTLESIPADYSTLSGNVDENTSGISQLKGDLGDIDNIIYSNIAKGNVKLNNSWDRVNLCENLNLRYGKTYRIKLEFDSVVSNSVYLYISNDYGDISAYKTTGDSTFNISYKPNKNLINIKLQVAGMYTGSCGCRVFDDEYDTKIEKLESELMKVNKKSSNNHGFLLGDMPKYEKQIISISTGVDDSFGPQGIATDGNYLYVTNSLGYIRKINIVTKEYTDTLVGYDILSHANSCDFSEKENAIYVCANGGNINNNKIVVVDTDTLAVKRIFTLMDESENPVYPHGIAVDRSNNHFYVALSFSKNGAIILVEFDELGKYVKRIEFDNSLYSTISRGTQQGLGFDGTYFYIPLHSVNFVQEYDCILIYDKDGNHVRTQTALKGLEIEDLCYDYARNRLFANYGYGGNFITEFVADSGWLNLLDYIESGIDNVTESTAKFRILNGVFYTRGFIKVTNSGDLFRLSSRVSPNNNKVNTMCVYSKDNNLQNAKITMVQWSSYTDTYDMQLSYAVYCPNKGYIWLNGGCVPM